MSKQRHFRIEYLVICVFVFLMAIGSLFDKSISQHLVNQNSLIATFFQIFGSIAPPLILFIASLIICFYALYQIRDNISKFTVMSVSIIGSAYAMWQLVKKCTLRLLCAINNFHDNIPIGVDSSDKIPVKGNVLFLIICITIILWGIGIFLIYTWIKNVKQAELQRLMFISLGGIVAFFLRDTFIDSMKDLWGRWRPREQLTNWNHFTNWYVINGKNGHQSFPSGHSASAWLSLYLPLFINPNTHKKFRHIAFILACIFGILVAGSRVFIGAHFLSDVTMGSFVSIIIVYCISRILGEHIDCNKL
nr:phosphatase PAP2 family protein [uncultured Ligilactobacillus sp.]